MKRSLGISNFLEEISSLSHPTIFLYFFALITEEGQLSHPYMITGKNIPYTRWKFVGKVRSLLFNMLYRLVKAFLPRRKCLLNSWPSSMLRK